MAGENGTFESLAEARPAGNRNLCLRYPQPEVTLPREKPASWRAFRLFF